jgi:hypothetical protein
LLISRLATHGLRRGLDSAAASRLEFAGFGGSVAAIFSNWLNLSRMAEINHPFTSNFSTPSAFNHVGTMASG